jgi:hypothetical protein
MSFPCYVLRRCRACEDEEEEERINFQVKNHDAKKQKKNELRRNLIYLDTFEIKRFCVFLQVIYKQIQYGIHPLKK